MKRKILLGLTTTDKKNWQNKIKEIDKLGIKEIALFPTCLDYRERREMYRLLEKTRLKKIPHVHLRSDFDEKEIAYLIKRYYTEVFNTHPELRSSHFAFMEKYKKRIFIENMEKLEDIFWEMIQECGGVCIDFSHWEDHGIIQEKFSYANFAKKLKDYRIGCCHISAIVKKNPTKFFKKKFDRTVVCYSNHRLKELSELDYIEKYLRYLPKYISIELENSLSEQLEAKKYLEKIINKN